MKNSMLLLTLISVTLFATPESQVNENDTNATNTVEKDVEKKEVPHKGSYYITPLPAFGQNPAWGTMYGAVVSGSWFMGDPETTSISTLQILALLTSKHQKMLTSKGTVYTEANDYKWDFDGRYLDTSQPTYGLGSGPIDLKPEATQFGDDGQLMYYNFYRFYLTLAKRIIPNLYFGIGYHYDGFKNVVDEDLELPDKKTSYYVYNERYGFDQENTVVSGLSLNLNFDTRDNINSTYKGRYAAASFHINEEFLGSDQSSTTLWLEYRDYFDLTDDHQNMLAIWMFGNFTTSGKLPYMDLPSVGYDQYSNSGRGYAQGYIRGQHLVYSEVEYRKKLIGTKNNPDFFGMVVFANVTTASDSDNDIQLFHKFDPAVGAGMRFMVEKTSRTVIEVDYAIGTYGPALYLGLNESF